MNDRFWSKVNKTNTCWLWEGTVENTGYGSFAVSHTKGVLAHRLAYELSVGEIPSGLTLDHLCRVRNCVNPDHLEPVTCAENIRRGGQAKLRPFLENIKHLYISGISQPKLAKLYRVNQSTISRVVNGKRWEEENM